MTDELSPRAIAALQNGAADMPSSEIARMPNIGRKTYYELMEHLGRRGRDFPNYNSAPVRPLAPAGISVYLTVAEMDELTTANLDLRSKIKAARNKAEAAFQQRLVEREAP